jgi:hypothetical protein
MRERDRGRAIHGQFMSTISGMPGPIACRAANTAALWSHAI